MIILKKRVLIILLAVIMVIGMTGCKRDDLEEVDIYTTVYPIEYITNYLYGEKNNVDSIYPAGSNPDTYKLTKKQINDYSKGAIFIYNGLGKEKNIARDLLNKNLDLRIIDVSQGLEYENSMNELWLNPSDYLMVANNIKTGLEEYIKNIYVKEDIDKKYDELKVLISGYDAELEMMGTNATDKNIIIASDALAFLSRYNLTVTNVDDTNKEVQQTTINKAKRLLSSGSCKYVYILKGQEESSIVKDLVKSGAQVKTIDSMEVLSEDEVKNKSDYKSIMRSNIDAIKEEIYVANN